MVHFTFHMFATIVATNDCYGHYGGEMLDHSGDVWFLSVRPSSVKLWLIMWLNWVFFGWDTALDFSTVVVNILKSICPGALKPVLKFSTHMVTPK